MYCFTIVSIPFRSQIVAMLNNFLILFFGIREFLITMIKFIRFIGIIIFETISTDINMLPMTIEAGADECYNHNSIEPEELLDLVFSLLKRKNYLDYEN